MNKDEKIIYNVVDNFVDFPNKYALSMFFPVCNLKCPFCYVSFWPSTPFIVPTKFRIATPICRMATRKYSPFD